MQLEFDNAFVRQLPADPNPDNRRRQVHAACYSRVLPTPVGAPRLIAHSREMGGLLGLNEAAVASPEFAQVFAGNHLLPGMEPYAACYGGHQFGNWAGQLGDGRAISLGEARGSDGGTWELQLKGAGPTPYSRTADGRAVMRSSVREFLCSEAMAHLGVPTTRALCLVGTGEQVLRDMFYDGNPRYEPGAIVTRVAPSFLRFGNFELFRSRADHDTGRRLLDYTLGRFFPALGAPGPESYAALFSEVCQKSAELVVQWQRVGFVHGVLNTDNMSILGLTLDYGPYGWLDNYDPNWTPNTTDAQGRRYRFGHQPQVVAWNLERLGEALLPLVGDAEPLNQGLQSFVDTFETLYPRMRAGKLGLTLDAGAAPSPYAVPEVVAELEDVLQLGETDMTIFYRTLARLPVEEATFTEGSDAALFARLREAYYAPEALGDASVSRIANWLRRYARCVTDSGLDGATRATRMNAVNPHYVLRNYLAQLAIDRAEQGDGSLVYELLDVLRRPYDEQPAQAKYAEKRPDWARSRAGCSMLSCSS